MFSLIRTNATLSNVNPRAEKHGDENVLACDLKFQVKLPNDVLSEFHPALKTFLYFKSVNPGDGDLVDEARKDDPGWLPNLRMPDLHPLKHKHELIGATLTIHAPIAKQNDIELDGCHVDGFTFDCQEGGTVIVTFRAQAHPDEKTIGKLCAHIQEEVEISVEPPEPGEGLIQNDGEEE